MPSPMDYYSSGLTPSQRLASQRQPGWYNDRSRLQQVISSRRPRTLPTPGNRLQPRPTIGQLQSQGQAASSNPGIFPRGFTSALQGMTVPTSTVGSQRTLPPVGQAASNLPAVTQAGQGSTNIDDVLNMIVDTPEPRTGYDRWSYQQPMPGQIDPALGLHSVHPTMATGYNPTPNVVGRVLGNGRVSPVMAQVESYRQSRPETPIPRPTAQQLNYGNLGSSGYNSYIQGFGNPSQGDIAALYERNGLGHLIDQPGVRTVANNTQETPRAFQPQQAIRSNGGSGYEEATLPGGSNVTLDPSGRAVVQGNMSPRRLAVLGVRENNPMSLVGVDSSGDTVFGNIGQMETERDRSQLNARNAFNRRRMQNMLLSRRLGVENPLPAAPLEPGASMEDIQAGLSTQGDNRERLQRMLGLRNKGDSGWTRGVPQVELNRQAQEQQQQLAQTQQANAASQELTNNLLGTFAPQLADGSVSIDQILAWRDRVLGGNLAGTNTNTSDVDQTQLALAEELVKDMTDLAAISSTLQGQRFPDAVIKKIMEKKKKVFTPKQIDDAAKQIEIQRKKRETPTVFKKELREGVEQLQNEYPVGLYGGF